MIYELVADLSRYTFLEANSHRYGSLQIHILVFMGLATRFREKNPTTADLKIFVDTSFSGNIENFTINFRAFLGWIPGY